MQLPGIVPQMGPIHATDFGTSFPADAIFCDLDQDFPSTTGPDPQPHGDGTIYLLPVDRRGALDRACKLHGWKKLTVSGNITFASDAFTTGGTAIYRAPTDSPIGGEFTVNIPSTDVTLSSLLTTGVQKWFEMSNQITERARVYDRTWPGRNAAGTLDTTAGLAAFSLDWAMPLSTATAPINPRSVSAPIDLGGEIYRAFLGNFNWYSGPDVAGWGGYPAPPPPSAVVPFDVVIRASAFCNCSCVRYNDGGWQYPVIIYYNLVATIEPSSGDWSGGYFGAPPIAADTDGFRPRDFGQLWAGTVWTGDPDASGVTMKWDYPVSGVIGPVGSQNFSTQYDGTDTGDAGFAVAARSHASLTLTLSDTVRWTAPPSL